MTKKRMLVLGLLVVLAAALAVPVVALGETTDTTTVTGQIGTYYNIVAPENFTMEITATSGGNSEYKTLSASTNDNTKNSVTISVREDGGDGCLSNGSTILSSALQLSGTNCNTVTLSNTNQNLVTNGTLSGTPKTFYVNNLVITQPPFNEVPAGDYTAIITFEATFNN